jgi:hypothetical protein
LPDVQHSPFWQFPDKQPLFDEHDSPFDLADGTETHVPPEHVWLLEHDTTLDHSRQESES